MRNVVGTILGALVLMGAVYAYKHVDTVQIGFPGVGMQVFGSEEELRARLDANEVPPALPAAVTTGPLAVDEYQNVRVLGHLTTAQFTRLMTAITLWVAPEQGCAYCHNTENLASDELYTKVVSRRMLQMTMHVNQGWQGHVQQTGVTCYTCHRGNPVPANVWFHEEPERASAVGWRDYQNQPVVSAGLTSLPANFFETFLERDTDVRVQSTEPLPTDNTATIQQTEATYALMMHFSGALGVNCTFCHNSRSWNDWSQSPVTRATAWRGIRLVRNLNAEYLEPLTTIFPDNRLGPTGDVPKVSCATCHNGAFRPLLGRSMLAEYPELARANEQPEKHQITVTDDHLEILTKIQFETGSAVILPRSRGLLDAVARYISYNPDIKALRVIGHADVTGDPEGNLALSQARAESVVRYLEGKGVAPTLSALGEGQNRPLCTELTAECNERNRRVEFLITNRASWPAAPPEGELPVEGEAPVDGAAGAGGEAPAEGAAAPVDE